MIKIKYIIFINYYKIVLLKNILKIILLMITFREIYLKIKRVLSLKFISGSIALSIVIYFYFKN